MCYLKTVFVKLPQSLGAATVNDLAGNVCIVVNDTISL